MSADTTKLGDATAAEDAAPANRPEASSPARARGGRVIPRERLERVEELYLSGCDEGEIQRAIAKAYGVTKRAARRYIRRVKAKLAERARGEDPGPTRLRVQTMLLEAFRTAAAGSTLHGPDAKAMVQAARTLAEVAGALGPKAIEISGRDGKPIQSETTARVVVVLPALEPDCAPEAGDGADAPDAG